MKVQTILGLEYLIIAIVLGYKYYTNPKRIKRKLLNRVARQIIKDQSFIVDLENIIEGNRLRPVHFDATKTELIKILKSE